MEIPEIYSTWSKLDRTEGGREVVRGWIKVGRRGVIEFYQHFTGEEERTAIIAQARQIATIHDLPVQEFVRRWTGSSWTHGKWVRL